MSSWCMLPYSAGCHTADIIMLLGHSDGYKSALCNLTGCHSAGYHSSGCHSSQRTSTICKDIFFISSKNE